jgi:hypothetical protein
MKEHALKVFRQPPERLNCAQAVLHAWREVAGDTSIALADLKPFGGGRAPDGLCGALRAAKVHPCETCVAHAAELLRPT